MSELRATYRLQLSADFGFARACELIPYLRDLGISHLYLSPSLQAREGSAHGYDVVEPGRLSDALGGSEDFERLATAAREAGMGLVLDVVPNHMAASEENPFWADPERRRQFFDLDPGSDRWRRFFDIDDLAGVRQEDSEVFAATHELTLSLVRRGLVDGLRVDHPDGLADPAAYLARLREAGAGRVWVEKILDPGEQLRDWPVSGTVGYEFLNDVCALFIDPAGEPELSSLWHAISADERPFAEVALEAKLEQARGTFSPEVERLARVLEGEVASEELAVALSSLPVYRTYVDAGAGAVDDEDRRVIERAGLSPDIATRLLLERQAPAEFVTRFQQTTPAIMAKGVEDTAFYRYGRLLALNDVGGDPSRFGITVERFHQGCLERAERFPEALLTTQTHDAKRSADVRARIGALAGMASDWRSAVEGWLSLTQRHVHAGAPDDVERYFIFQTLVGAWPIEPDRLQAYMIKALREAKRNSAWVDGNEDWEARVLAFCRALYEDEEFCAELDAFARELTAVAERAVLGQVVLKLTTPGIPDIYQGDELPLLALVDPDNRRPVDWHWRGAMLRRLMGGSPPHGATLKMFLILRLLGLRARRPRSFLGGGYEPLDGGPDVCAFQRGGEVLVVVAVRPAGEEASLAGAPGRWRDVLRGEERTLGEREPVGEIVGPRGFAVLERLP